MQIPSSLAPPSALAGEARARPDVPPRSAAEEARSPAVKLELSPLARRPSFPPSPDLRELASSLDPKDRAQQLAATLEGPGVPVALKLLTLKMMLAGEAPPIEGASQSVEGPESSVSSSRDSPASFKTEA